MIFSITNRGAVMTESERAGRERTADLPISRLMMDRIEAISGANRGRVDLNDAIAPMLAAIVSLEELVRFGAG
jgi:hypothetical protein